MARARNLKPGFFKNEELAKLPHGARLLFQGLWTIADRKGRLEDRPARIKAEIFPYERVPVEKWLSMLAASSFIIRYESNGQRFIQVATFLRHQTPHVKEPESLIPEPDQSQTGMSTVCHAPYTVIGNGETGRGKQEEGKAPDKFSAPSVQEVATYCLERANGLDAEAFVAYYASKGWRVGKSPMKDWKSAVVTWEKNKGTFSHGNDSARQRPKAIEGIADYDPK